jgi:hypothetical protein
MIECVAIPQAIARSAVKKRLRYWEFFNGPGYEGMQFIRSLEARSGKDRGGGGGGGRMNVVCMDGSRIMGDGEIRMGGGGGSCNNQSSETSGTSPSVPVWPSTQSGDQSQYYRSNTTSNTENINVLKNNLYHLSAQVSLAEIHYGEIEALVESKRIEMDDLTSGMQILQEEIKSIQFQGKTFPKMHDLKKCVDEALRVLGVEETRRNEDKECLEEQELRRRGSREALQIALDKLLDSLSGIYKYICI